MEFKIIKKDTVTSTNTLLKQMALESAQSGTVLTAKTQTQGRGRMGRSFFSPETGLYFSLLTDKMPQNNPLLLTVLAGVAVMKGIEDVYSISTNVKWVNDIMLNGKKVCGILTEGVSVNGKLKFAVVGVGVNIAPANFPEEIKNTAASLNGDISKKDELLERILFHFSEEMESDGFLDYYRRKCETVGKNIKLITADGKIENAYADGIADNGGLIVKMSDETTRVVTSGEVSVR